MNVYYVMIHGYIQDKYKTTMCNCLKQRLFNIEFNKSNLNNLDKENFNNFNINLYSDTPNKEKYKSNISPRENTSIIKDICLNFIKNFNNPEEKNLLFTGGTRIRKNIFI